MALTFDRTQEEYRGIQGRWKDSDEMLKPLIERKGSSGAVIKR